MTRVPGERAAGMSEQRREPGNHEKRREVTVAPGRVFLPEAASLWVEPAPRESGGAGNPLILTEERLKS